MHHAAKRFGTLCLSRPYRPERFGRYGHAFIYWDGLTELSARFGLDSHTLCELRDVGDDAGSFPKVPHVGTVDVFSEVSGGRF